MSNNIILTKTFNFSIEIIHLYMELLKHKEFVLSKQVLRAGTSIGANVEESVGALTRKDFINKMTISYREARETRYWLRLLEASKIVNFDFSKYINESEEIIKILSSIIKTSKGD
ncbi:MAG: four helix bundle protein [Cytophagaceae bacterium]